MQTLGRVRIEEIGIVLLLVFFGLSGSIPGIAPNQASEMTGAASTVLQKVTGIGSQIFVNGLILLLLVRHRQLFATRQATLRWASSLAVWALLSVMWSADLLLTARRAVPFALATCFGLLLALRFPQRRLLFLLQLTFGILAAWSAVLALGFPAIGLDASTGHGGDWQGVFTQKNACGRAMVFALATVLACGLLSAGRTLLLLAFTAELVLSGSRGAWVLGGLTAVALALFVFSCRLDRRARVALIAGSAAAAAVASAILLSSFASFAVLLGRDPTLTGRTAIWHEVWLAIQRRPALGYGFSAFWQGAKGASWGVVVALKFVLFHAHNGFLEIWLELGAVGLLLFAFAFARAAFLLWPEVRTGHFQAAAWPLAMLLLALLYDLDENTLLSFNGIFPVLYTCTLMRIEMLSAERTHVVRVLANAPAPLASPLPLAFPKLRPLFARELEEEGVLPQLGIGQKALYPTVRTPWL